MNTAFDNLQITAFRGLRDVRLEQLGRVNLLVGGNNSGKTSVLEAAMLFGRPADSRTWMQASGGRETRVTSRNLAASVRWLFPVKQRGPESLEDRPGEPLVITGKGTFPIRSLRANYSEAPVWLESPNKSSDEAGTSSEELVRLAATVSAQIEWERSEGGPARAEGELIFGPDPTHLRMPRITARSSEGLRGVPALRSELIKPQIHRTGEAPVRALSEAITGGYKSEVVVLLQSIDPDILDIDIVQDDRWEPQIIIQHRLTGPTPLTVFGDGVRRAAVIAALIPRTKGGILLIDELETALHVSVLKPVLGLLGKAVGELGVQVFATTHSLEAVDAVLNTLPHMHDEVVLFHLEVKDGARQVKRFSGEQLGRLRLERGLDIR